MDEPVHQLDQLKGLWETCKSQDDQKQTLIEGLFSHVKGLNKQLEEAKRESKQQKDYAEYFREKKDQAEEKFSLLVDEKDRHSFAVVLIDGDCMPFKDDLIKDGAAGGRQAAHSLRQAIKKQLCSAPDGKLSNVQIVVRVYANLKGLGRVYHDAGILPPQASLDDFVRGFNMADALFDFVDAGNGKECSDEKIRGLFRLNLDDVHCRHVFFGGSADNGYARMLEPLTGDKEVCRRITLLEGPSFAAELADIKDCFNVAAPADVFRTEKLHVVKRRVSFNFTPPATPSAAYASIAAKPASPAPGDASAAAARVATTTVPPPPVAPLAGPSSATARAAASSGGGGWAVVRKNEQGQRVDAPLDYSQFDFQMLKSKRLCNSFHLLGDCFYQACYYTHGDRLPADKRPALLAVSRLSPCPRGLQCSDNRCISGHRCPRPDCQLPTCSFAREMHRVDTRIVM